MAVEFEKLQFKKNWNNSADFPTYEENEAQVRADLQALHDETKEFINEKLIPNIENLAVPGSGDMLAAIYDPNRKRKDVFQYAEDKKAEAVEALRQHIANQKNPHKVTAADAGAAAEKHSHEISNVTGLQPVLDAIRSKVGDTFTTGRTDLDDTWLLCNGDSVAIADYEELAAIISKPLYRTRTDKDLWNYQSAANSIKCVAYGNGYWVVGGLFHGGGAICYARIAYTTDPTGTWTIKDLWSGSGSTTVGITGIVYADGRWVVSGKNYDGSSNYAKIAYTDDVTGEWTIKDVWTSGALECIAHADGKWVVGGWQGANASFNARIAYTDDVTKEWTFKDLWNGTSSGNAVVTDIAYGDGFWAACGVYYNGSNSSARVAYTDDLTGIWGTKDLWSGDTWTNSRMANCITYANGYWAVGGHYYTGSYVRGQLAHTTDLSGSWTTSQVMKEVCRISYLAGLWLILGWYDNTGTIMYATDITGSLTNVALWTGSSAAVIKDVAYADGCLLFGGVIQDSNGYYARISFENQFALPAISLDDVYTYIKAKEG